ncbi:hypothetical protein DFQ30_006224 [Apophysomyces sp. BC1015]|nr:hypothetical protein DFQ30_006224 [Apophysomyces sp. BC1015]
MQQFKRKSHRYVNQSSEDDEISADSSDSDSLDDEYGLFLNASTSKVQGHLHDLMLKLQRQHAKQSHYIEKTRSLNRSIQKTSRKIGKLTKLVTEQALESERSAFMKHANKEKEIIDMPTRPERLKKEVPYESLSPSPVQQLQLAKRTGSPSFNLEAKKQRLESPPTPISRDPKPATRNERQPEAIEHAEIPIATEEYCDLYLHRSQHVVNKGFDKKPRSLLYNIAQDGTKPCINDLMVTTSLDGNLSFWDASTKRHLKTIGKGFLYSTWIEDLCWATPTTLALCPAGVKKGPTEDPSNETVSMVHIQAVDDETVEGRVQSLQECPHEKGMSVIASFDSGQRSTANVEHAQFVTGGNDKSVYLWNLRRENPSDDFTVSSVDYLNIKHTSVVQALCYDKYHNKLFTGGSDERFFAFDMQRQTTVSELKLAGRVNHILQDPANPNLILSSLSTKSEQFALYDQRCRGANAIQLRFGYWESENVSRYIRPDLHKNGYMVVCGGQSDSKIHFCFDVPGKARILRTIFLPDRDTLVSLTSSRTMTWTQFHVQPNSTLRTL